MTTKILDNWTWLNKPVFILLHLHSDLKRKYSRQLHRAMSMGNGTVSGSGADYFMYSLCLSCGLWLFIANSVILYVFARYKDLRTLSNACIINIFIVDWITGFIYVLGGTLYLQNYNDRIDCLFRLGTTMGISMQSLQSLFIVTLERYIKICHPYSYVRMVKTSTVIAILTVSWIISIITGGISITKDQWKPSVICFVSQITHPDISMALRPYPSMLLLGMFVLNISIVRAVQKQNKKIHIMSISASEDQQKQENQMQSQRTKVISYMLLFFYVCYFPLMVVMFIDTFCSIKAEWYIQFSLITVVISIMNNLVNPVVFGWKDAELKMFIRKAFKRNTFI